MPEKEKLAEVQALTDTLDTMPETAKQQVLGIAAANTGVAMCRSK